MRSSEKPDNRKILSKEFGVTYVSQEAEDIFQNTWDVLRNKFRPLLEKLDPSERERVETWEDLFVKGLNNAHDRGNAEELAKQSRYLQDKIEQLEGKCEKIMREEEKISSAEKVSGVFPEKRGSKKYREVQQEAELVRRLSERANEVARQAAEFFCDDPERAMAWAQVIENTREYENAITQARETNEDEVRRAKLLGFRKYVERIEERLEKEKKEKERKDALLRYRSQEEEKAQKKQIVPTRQSMVKTGEQIQETNPRQKGFWKSLWSGTKQFFSRYFEWK